LDFSSLYELVERFHRTNQLPAFLVGVLVSIPLGILALRLMRAKMGASSVFMEKIERLENQIDGLRSEKEQLRNELSHAKEDATARGTLIGELKGRSADQTQKITDLTAVCEGLKEELSELEREKNELAKRCQKARGRALKLSEKLQSVEVSNGRIWEVSVPASAFPFRALSQRRTPIISLVNLKGGVGKTTITANLAVAMNKLGWRVLLVDLDHQGSLSQLLLADSELNDLLVSRRFVHDALNDPADGLASFRRAMVRLTKVPQSKTFLVAANEELGDLETALSQRWPVKLTTDDVRYRLRAILHAKEISDQFDFILLDCPPRLTTACINALAASDYVLIPVLPSAISTVAVPRLLTWMRHLRRTACPELAVMGVIGNKVKYFKNSPVKRLQSELDSLAVPCQDAWGESVKFFPPLRVHDPSTQPLPALEPGLGSAYLDIVDQLNKELPSYARSRSPKLSASVNSPVGGVRG
jgi:cellulose biosynthesis protein BcsQ